jgi:hypothetical protein
MLVGIRRIVFMIVDAFVIVVSSAVSFAQCGPQWLEGDPPPGISQPVTASCIWDPDGPGPKEPLWALAMGEYTSQIIGFDRKTARWTALGTPFSGVVYSMTATRSGGLVVGGWFTLPGAAKSSGVARWNGSSWVAMGTGLTPPRVATGPTSPQQYVTTLAEMPDGTIIAGGRFQGPTGLVLNNIAAWNGSTWSSMAGGITSSAYLDDPLSPVAVAPVQSMAVLSDGRLVVTGDFYRAGTMSAGSLAYWNGSSWSTEGEGLRYDSGSIGSGSLLVPFPDGGFAIHGGFNRINTTPIQGAWARRTAAGWHALNNPSYPIYPRAAISTPGGDLVVVGTPNAFDSLCVIWTGMEWRPVGSRLISGTRGETGILRTVVAFPDGQILVGGSFNASYGAWKPKNIATLREGDWSPVGPVTDGSISDSTQTPTGEIVAIGSFTKVGGTPVRSLARWNGARWHEIGSDALKGFPYAVSALNDGTILVAGSSLSLPSEPTQNHSVLRWNGFSWSPMGDLSSVSNIETNSRGDIYCVGAKTRVDDATIYQWTGNRWTQLGEVLSRPRLSDVKSIAFDPDGRLFTLVEDKGVLTWNGSEFETVASKVFLGYPYGGSLCITRDRRLFAAAVIPEFNTYTSGVLVQAIGSIWTGVNPPVRFQREHAYSFFPVSPISSIRELSDGGLVVAGKWGGGSAGLTRWDGTALYPYGTGTDGSVQNVFPQPNNDLIITGDFDTVGGKVSKSLARWSHTGGPTVAEHPSTAEIRAGQTVTLTAMPGNGYANVTAAWLRNGVAVAEGPGGASPAGGIVTGASRALPSPTYVSGAALILTNAQPSDSGEYAVEFRNSCGSVVSRSVAVTVLPPCPCAADFDGSGGPPNTNDVTVFFNAWLAGNPAADVDCSGSTPDTADIDVFFNEWLAGGC